MFICETTAGFHFHNQFFLNQKIGKIIPQYCSIFIKNFNRMLLHYMQACLSQPMSQTIFINLL